MSIVRRGKSTHKLGAVPAVWFPRGQLALWAGHRTAKLTLSPKFWILIAVCVFGKRIYFGSDFLGCFWSC